MAGRPAHSLLEAIGVMRGLYERDQHDLPVSSVLSVGRLWHAALEGPDRERARAALEVATLLNLRRTTASAASARASHADCPAQA